jgi:hypothetical protein
MAAVALLPGWKKKLARDARLLKPNSVLRSSFASLLPSPRPTILL